MGQQNLGDLILAMRVDQAEAEKKLAAFEAKIKKARAAADRLKEEGSKLAAFTQGGAGGNQIDALMSGFKGQFQAFAGQGIALGITQGLIGSGIDQSSFLTRSAVAAGTGALTGGPIGAAFAVLGQGLSELMVSTGALIEKHRRLQSQVEEEKRKAESTRADDARRFQELDDKLGSLISQVLVSARTREIDLLWNTARYRQARLQ